MIIGIDAREIQNGVYTGIGRALFNFLDHFDRQPGMDRCILFSSKPISFTFSGRIRNRVVKEKCTFWWDQVKLAAALKKEKVDVFYSPYYKVPLLASCKKVSAILDLIYLRFEPYRRRMPWFKKLYYYTVARYMAHAVDRVWTSSQYSLEDVVKLYGVDRNKIDVVSLSVAEVYRPETDEKQIAAVKKIFRIPGRYLLYVGNFKAHKNVATLLEAFRQVAATSPGLSLVLAGPRADGYAQLLRWVADQGLAAKIIFTGKMTEGVDLRSLYSGAEIFVMPSFYEGFGIPPIEAMACGVPVVSSRASSLPEVVGDAGVLVDPNDPKAFAQAIMRILEDGEFRKSLVARGLKQVEQFRPSVTAERMYDLLKKVHSGRQSL